jgi:hypothetical protein
MICVAYTTGWKGGALSRIPACARAPGVHAVAVYRFGSWLFARPELPVDFTSTVPYIGGTVSESWQNGYCTSLENWRPQGLGGSNPSLSAFLSHTPAENRHPAVHLDKTR